MREGYRMLREDRGVLSLKGPDLVPFLQGVISNDAARAADDRAIYAALLTPQGKFLHDFFLVGHDGGLLLDCEGERRGDLFQRLRRYRLRSRVEMADVTEEWTIAQLWGDAVAEVTGLPAGEAGVARPWGSGVAFVDPRLPALGARAILPRAGAEEALAATELAPAGEDEWDAHRLPLGVPDGSRDMPVEKAYLLESGFEELNGVDFEKGCYVGQELTARTKYRGLVRKRLMPVRIEGEPDEQGRITYAGKDAGELRSRADGWGLALLRLETVDRARNDAAPLESGAARITPETPGWMRLPEKAAS